MNQKRINNVLQAMNDRGMDNLIISDPSSIDYLINYKNNPGERMYVLLLSLSGQHTLFMNQLFYLDKELDIDIVWYKDTDDYISMIADRLDDASCVGIDKLWPAKFLMTLMPMLDECYFKLGSECIDCVRMIKDVKEQELMRKSSLLNDQAIDKVIDLCSNGKLSELEVTEQVTKIYQSLGCESFSFPAIIAYGANGADGHHEGDLTMLKPGDSIVIDMGGMYQGYCSDMTRTVFYKEVNAEQRKVYELVKHANEAAEAMIKPGVKLCDIDKTARDIIDDAGYGENFNHRLGHFIGKDVHEYGDVSAAFDMEVKEGMIFSIEPGIYIQGQFGVRIEDLVLVTKNGCEVLNHYSKNLKVIG